MKTELECILLIDDDEATNYLNRLIISRTGRAKHVKAWQNAEEALECLAGTNKTEGMGNPCAKPDPSCTKPDLIFLDINMPGWDGWDFLDEYKRLPMDKKGKTVIVMLTNSFNPDDERRARQESLIAGFMNKPLTTDAVEEVIATYFPN
jgi:CheY-like chemotaxis protein